MAMRQVILAITVILAVRGIRRAIRKVKSIEQAQVEEGAKREIAK
jgi:hypothetical protein